MRVARTPDEAAALALRLPSVQIVLSVGPVLADQVRALFFGGGAMPEGGGV